jgi:hypothetical protein
MSKQQEKEDDQEKMRENGQMTQKGRIRVTEVSRMK